MRCDSEYDIKYSDLIQIICKQIYLTHTPGQSGVESNEEVLYIPKIFR